jgi:uncharacterized protein with ATP-grasp and redox domains
MLNLYGNFKKMVEQSPDPFDTAMRLAIAGNVIDFGPQHQLDVMDTIHRVLNAKLTFDHSKKLKEDLTFAKTILYIGDNAGEIVLDKIFLETINHHNIYFCVRGGAVINDATVEDATLIGMDGLAKIITTGDNAPGVLWETASPEFKQIFNKADVIISKGQGNLEGLIDLHQNIYFLLVTKCSIIANLLDVPERSFVVLRKAYFKKTLSGRLKEKSSFNLEESGLV